MKEVVRFVVSLYAYFQSAFDITHNIGVLGVGTEQRPWPHVSIVWRVGRCLSRQTPKNTAFILLEL